MPTPSQPSCQPYLFGFSAGARVQVVEQQLAVDARAVGDAPGRVESQHDVVAQGARGVGLVLHQQALDQHVGDRADGVERLPARGLVARGLGEPEAQRVARLPLDPVRGELLARGLRQRGGERREVQVERGQVHLVGRAR